MTRLDVAPPASEGPVDCDGPRALVVEAREVPLGGVRAMEVHRTLPHRALPMVGAWCFLDRFGPQETVMRVEPHPHIGLQTVTWPIIGEVRHRDAVGSDVVVRPGALNLMTSGEGIAHSEYSVGEEPIPLDALQLWVALPESRRHGPPAFERHEHLPVRDLADGADAVVVMGELGGVSSPATVHTPIVGAELRLPPGVMVRVPLRTDWEYALSGMIGTADVETGVDATDADAAQRPVPLARTGNTTSVHV
ncbi:MAG: pirin family protein, partial [Microbacterium sp.]|uniref:pirin family protein n=1 Tax=Microbacterium sp. TaxID=51671 RepID=UPI001AC2C294